jgi:hypothetical protein
MNKTIIRRLRLSLWILTIICIASPFCAGTLEEFYGCSLGPKHVDPCYLAGIDISYPLGFLAWYGAVALILVFPITILVTIATWNKLKE